MNLNKEECQLVLQMLEGARVNGITAAYKVVDLHKKLVEAVNDGTEKV